MSINMEAYLIFINLVDAYISIQLNKPWSVLWKKLSDFRSMKALGTTVTSSMKTDYIQFDEFPATRDCDKVVLL